MQITSPRAVLAKLRMVWTRIRVPSIRIRELNRVTLVHQFTMGARTSFLVLRVPMIRDSTLWWVPVYLLVIVILCSYTIEGWGSLCHRFKFWKWSSHPELSGNLIHWGSQFIIFIHTICVYVLVNTIHWTYALIHANHCKV